MKQVWLDVTTLWHWRSTAVGIVRVEMECARYALAQGDGAMRFCRFDRLQGYQEVNTEELAKTLKRLMVSPEQVDLGSPTLNRQALGGHGRLAMYKAFIRSLLKHLPGAFQKAIWQFLASRQEGVFAALRTYREGRVALRQLFFPKPFVAGSSGFTAKPYAKLRVPFDVSDVYLSMGLDWERKDLEYLYAQKRQIGFQVTLFCYDIIPVKLPQACVSDVAAIFALYFTNVAWCADRILCISQSSLNDLSTLLTQLGAPQKSMQVVHLGCDIQRASGYISPEIKTLCEKPFLLFVSTIERRKNHETLYRAYVELINQGVVDLPQLLFVGKIGWGVDDLLKDLQLDPRTHSYIQVLNHVTDAELAVLYESALFTLYPSLYEGWGLPIAESLAHGKFCLTSNNSSLPEVGQDYVEYLNAWDVPSWANKIAWYCKNPQALHEKEQRILANYRATSWQDSSKSILKSAADLLQS